MPSFFTAMGRILQGKPVFDPNDQPTSPPPGPLPPMDNQGEEPDPSAPGAAQAPSGSTQPGITKHDEKTFPVVYIKRTLTRPNGSNMQVYCYVHNNWTGRIELQKVRLLGRDTRLGYELKPGEEREILVYNGPQLPRPGEDEALLDYKTPEGDYFEARHDVRFRFDSNQQTYAVDEINLRPPVRDIYG